MNPTLNILGISGSLRAQSRNTGLLRFAKQCLPHTVNFQIADLADVPFTMPIVVIPNLNQYKC